MITDGEFVQIVNTALKQREENMAISDKLEEERDRWKEQADLLGRECENWKATAAQHLRNEQYYRGLIEEIGRMIGPDAFTDDTGSMHESVLCAKVPECVKSLLDHIEDIRQEGMDRDLAE